MKKPNTTVTLLSVILVLVLTIAIGISGCTSGTTTATTPVPGATTPAVTTKPPATTATLPTTPTATAAGIPTPSSPTATAGITAKPSPSPSLTGAASPSPTASAGVTAKPSPSPSITGAASPSPTASAAAVPAYTVMTVTSITLGNYLADGKGMALYYNTGDSAGTSNVAGVILNTWPIFYTPSIIVPPLLNAANFTSITRSDGKMQTAYRGYPLYYYVNDKTQGDIKGQALEGVWYIVNPDRFPPTPTPGGTISPTVSASPVTSPVANR